MVSPVTKPYTEVQFTAQITQDRNWRIKEISDLKNAIRVGDDALKRVLLRALVTVCYAHWEGYVRFSAQKYLQHVALRRHKYSELDQQFFRNYFLPRLGALKSSNTSVADRCALVSDILNSSELRFSRVNDDLVKTRSNLSYSVFSDICLVCGISGGDFSRWSTFIDVFLLKRRNSIAHGEETLIGLDELEDLTSNTISLIRTFGTALENHVVLKSYKVA